MSAYIWLIPLLPMVAFGINALFGRRWLGEKSHYIATLGVAGAFVLSIIVLLNVINGARLDWDLYTWIPAGDFRPSIGFYVDPLTAIMLIVVTTVSLLVHIYSIGYMHKDPGYYRFFTYLPLFTFAMLMLVLANNLLLLYVFWEAVGLCSYLLIGFWYEKKSASDAAKKAFIVNRVGDFGFGLGVMLVFTTFGTIAYSGIFGKVPEASTFVLTIITLLLFAGAMGKSAQFPLHVWLPDAMEGPTPVSALIHAATMVTAGVYMVARLNPLFHAAPISMNVVAIVGVVTAIFAASIGLVQNDMKRIMAYSTVSQLGYMFFALGVGAWVAAIFHLMTHAFFKALLFLGSGSVMHGMEGELNIQKMGGLGKRMPKTTWTMWVASLAIAGIFPLAGFWSKDEILGGVFNNGNYIIFGLGLLGAFMTAFYVFRAVFLTFHGEPRSHAAEHAHESPSAMTIPLIILAILSAVAGVIAGFPPEGGWIHTFLAPVFEAGRGVAATAGEAGGAAAVVEAVGFTTTTIILMAASMLVAVMGIGLAWLIYARKAISAVAIGRAFRPLYVLFYNKYFVDEIYNVVFIRSGLRFAEFWWWFDDHIIDGAVNGVASVVNVWSGGLRRIQTGFVQNYAMAMSLGVFVMLTVYLFVRR